MFNCYLKPTLNTQYGLWKITESGEDEQNLGIEEIQKGFWKHATNGAIHDRRPVTSKVTRLRFCDLNFLDFN